MQVDCPAEVGRLWGPAAAGGECGNELQAALIRGHAEVVQMLPDQGANKIPMP